MPWWLSLMNSVVGGGSAVFGVMALLRPAALAPPSGTGPGGRFYPAMYAARSVAPGALVVVAVWPAPARPLTALVLAAAALAQAGDVVIGVRYRLPGMAGGAALAAACHTAGTLLAL